MKKDIKKLVSYYIKKFDTTNPFEKANAFKVFDGISTKKVNANRKVTPKNFGVTQKSV